MLLFGHRFIPSERFYHIEDIDAIAHTPGNALLYVDFDEKHLDIIEHMRLNRQRFALGVTSLRDAIYAENLGAAFIVADENIADTLQKTAENYLFDAKILCRIHDEADIEAMALERIDGVIFADAVIKVSS